MNNKENVKSAILKNDRANNIVCFGDSMTAWQYPTVLQRLLDIEYGNKKYTVIDKGLSTTETAYILSIINSTINQYNPRAIIVMTGNNDYEVNPYYSNKVPQKQTNAIIGKIKIIKLFLLLKKELFYAGYSRSAFVQEQPVIQKSNRDKEYQQLISKGREYLLNGNKMKAEKLFYEAISIRPDAWDPYEYIEIIHFAADFESKKKLFLQFAKTSKEYSLKKLARLYFNQKDYKRAITTYKKVIQLYPDDEDSYHMLLYIYRMMGYKHQTAELLSHSKRLSGALAVWHLEKHEYELSKRYFSRVEQNVREQFEEYTAAYLKLIVDIARTNNILVFCMQYPMRNIDILRNTFSSYDNVVFVDNEKIFKTMVEERGFNMLFMDQFAGDFGHCTEKGNELIAQNILAVFKQLKKRHIITLNQ